jgi:hypothetical protein
VEAGERGGDPNKVYTSNKCKNDEITLNFLFVRIKKRRI